eukprot:6459182-Amphidinium_carterae.2
MKNVDKERCYCSLGRLVGVEEQEHYAILAMSLLCHECNARETLQHWLDVVHIHSACKNGALCTCVCTPCNGTKQQPWHCPMASCRGACRQAFGLHGLGVCLHPQQAENGSHQKSSAQTRAQLHAVVQDARVCKRVNLM